METVEITIERRATGGKGAARQLRRTGKVPATLYGPKRSATSVTVVGARVRAQARPPRGRASDPAA